MNMLHRTCMRQFRRFVETSATSKSKLFVEPLVNRSLIRVQGKEVVPFLQGLITNDMHHLHDGSSSMFTMFLNNAGRVLYDSIIYKTPWADTFLIECDREASNELRRHLRLYRVRKKIDIDCINSEYTPWIVYNPAEGVEASNNLRAEGNDESTHLIYSADPRVKDLGVRIIQPQSNESKHIAKLFPNTTLEQPATCNYISHRYSNGVGEGIIDHPPGKCFPLEANCDFLNGVSFHKGCYVGQELTARVYHTGVVRKRLMPITLTSDLDTTTSTVQTQAGAVVGTVRGTSHRNALALLRVEQVLKAKDLMIDGQLCTVSKPFWWPNELPNTQSIRRD